MLRPGLSWGAPPKPAANTGAAARRYLNDSVENASPAELTNMLYVEALRCIDTAAELFGRELHGDALPLILKAQNIVVELRTSLNPEAGDIAISLDSVYTWVYRNLLLANAERNTKHLTEARTHLGELAEAWAQMLSTNQ